MQIDPYTRAKPATIARMLDVSVADASRILELLKKTFTLNQHEVMDALAYVLTQHGGRTGLIRGATVRPPWDDVVAIYVDRGKPNRPVVLFEPPTLSFHVVAPDTWLRLNRARYGVGSRLHG